MGVTAAMVSVGFNSPEYGGSFGWSFTVPQYLLVLTALVVLGLYPIVCLADAKVDTCKSYVRHFGDMIRVFELDGIWRVAFALFGCALCNLYGVEGFMSCCTHSCMHPALIFVCHSSTRCSLRCIVLMCIHSRLFRQLVDKHYQQHVL
jgi:hypothetical protein